MMRQCLELLQQELSRRSFIRGAVKAAGIAVFWDRFGEQIFAQGTSSTTDPKAVYSAIGNIVIPVDQDPGWASYEPGISDYGLNIFVRQALLGGHDQAEATFQGLLGAIVTFNDIPPLIGYGTARFLDMAESVQATYFGEVLSGQFENQGAQDVLFLAAFVGIFSTRAVFFSNYPNHLAVPGAEFQVKAPGGPKTGWDIMGFRGPVGPEEEKRLRDRFANVEVLPGMDPKNIYI